MASWVASYKQLVSQDHSLGASGADTAEPKGRAEYMEAKEVKDFVTALLAHLPPEVQNLLMTFDASDCECSGKEQDGLVFQAIQGTQAYQEIVRIERSEVLQKDSTAGEECNVNCGGNAEHDDPPDSSCDCSSRHILSVVAYAILTILHKLHKSVRSSAESADGARVWHRDPLGSLPLSVASEARHVATILEGLVQMEKSNTQSLLEPWS